jgi:hypothetical protein
MIQFKTDSDGFDFHLRDNLNLPRSWIYANLDIRQRRAARTCIGSAAWFVISGDIAKLLIPLE